MSKWPTCLTYLIVHWDNRLQFCDHPIQQFCPIICWLANEKLVSLSVQVYNFKMPKQSALSHQSRRPTVQSVPKFFPLQFPTFPNHLPGTVSQWRRVSASPWVRHLSIGALKRTCEPVCPWFFCNQQLGWAVYGGSDWYLAFHVCWMWRDGRWWMECKTPSATEPLYTWSEVGKNCESEIESLCVRGPEFGRCIRWINQQGSRGCKNIVVWTERQKKKWLRTLELFRQVGSRRIAWSLLQYFCTLHLNAKWEVRTLVFEVFSMPPI